MLFVILYTTRKQMLKVSEIAIHSKVGIKPRFCDLELLELIAEIDCGNFVVHLND